MKALLIKIYSQVIRRQVPFAVLSWRYLLPNQHPMVTLHKQAFLQALPRYSRPVWCLIALYGYTAWFLFFAWKHILVAFRREREYLYREHNVAPLKHLSALLKLTLLHTIPPSYYYRHQLFKSKEAAWLLHIFDFECANIHKQMSPNISCHSKTVISDKHVFATEMAANHIPIVASTQLIETSREDLYLSLLQNRPLFLKPTVGYQKRGCFQLNYSSSDNLYSLEGNDDVNIEGGEAIVSYLLPLIKKQQYILQPLLENHPALVEQFGVSKLITIRLITQHTEQSVKVISAILEVPHFRCFNVITPFYIELEFGEVLTKNELRYNAHAQSVLPVKECKGGFILPCWSQVLDIASRAHAELADIQTLGWDFAITADGPKLIEGNINWGVSVHQLSGNACFSHFN